MIKITYHDFSNGPIEQCCNLCNARMYLQAERSKKHTMVLRSMNFDTCLNLPSKMPRNVFYTWHTTM
ncbi:MAG: hypothetical protein LKI76_03475 [Megasphaera sp.]|uniref:hypothetical protein n=1 Tax=Megasphaera sueciensis TaxID=349094 RepID=UPI003D0431C6|nr:hypothetical protein [Megasphaera sp.]MCI1822982.1 hypothetical protein [Megasphaera sp.]